MKKFLARWRRSMNCPCCLPSSASAHRSSAAGYRGIGKRTPGQSVPLAENVRETAIFNRGSPARRTNFL